MHVCISLQVDLITRGELPLRTMEPDIVSLLVEEMAAMGVNWVRPLRFSTTY